MAIDPDQLVEDEEEAPVAKEMFDATFRRVDVVKGPAHAMRFVVLKAGQDQDPAAVAMVQKAEMSAKSVNDLPDSAFAYIEPGGEKDDEGKTTPRSLRHFPIHDEAHARNALSRAPQSPFGEKAMPKIRAAAKKFGIDVKKSQEAQMTAKTKATEATDAPIAEDPQPVVKADGDEELDVTEVLAEPDGDAAGAEEVPGSPAWEAVDAATARKWTAVLSRAKHALTVMADREGMEVASGGDGDDADNAFDLMDAACAIDYAVSVLAPIAVDEQAESDRQSEELRMVAKTLRGAADIESDLDTLEGLAPVRKAGRVLSAANEALIKGASESLQKVLASLPAAPEAVTKAQEPEEMTVTEHKAEDDEQEDEAEEPVTKAKGDPMVAVYDAKGRLLGAVAEEKITPLSTGTPADEQEASEAPATDEEEAPATEAAEAPVAPAAASAAPVAPEDDQQVVAKSLTDLREMVKSAVAEALGAADEEHRKVVKSLEERLAFVESQPAPGGPLMRGVALGGMVETSGGRLALRGQGTPADHPSLEPIRKALEAETDPVMQAQLRRELSMQEMKLRLSGS